MDDLNTTLAKKAQENVETMQLLVEGMQRADSDEKRIKLLVHFMRLTDTNRRIIAEVLTDDELQIMKDDMNNEWNIWQKANTAEGTVALFNYYADKRENE